MFLLYFFVKFTLKKINSWSCVGRRRAARYQCFPPHSLVDVQGMALSIAEYFIFRETTESVQLHIILVPNNLGSRMPWKEDQEIMASTSLYNGRDHAEACGEVPVTTQENLMLHFSDTAFDLMVVSKEGCVSSVSCAMILQSVLLCNKRQSISRVIFNPHAVSLWEVIVLWIDKGRC